MSCAEVSFGSWAAVPTTLAARQVYPRLLTTYCNARSRKDWAMKRHAGDTTDPFQRGEKGVAFY